MENRGRKSSANDTIRLDPEGDWFQGEYPVLHDRTVQFLHKNIAVDEEGNYYLTGEDKPVYFKVEDVPYWVRKIEKTIAGYLITLTDDSIELLNFSNLWIGKKKALYCLVKGGTLPAKFMRGPYYEITNNLVQKGSKFFLVFNNKKYLVQLSPPKVISHLGKKKLSSKKARRKKKWIKKIKKKRKKVTHARKARKAAGKKRGKRK